MSDPLESSGEFFLDVDLGTDCESPEKEVVAGNGFGPAPFWPTPKVCVAVGKRARPTRQATSRPASRKSLLLSCRVSSA